MRECDAKTNKQKQVKSGKKKPKISKIFISGQILSRSGSHILRHNIALDTGSVSVRPMVSRTAFQAWLLE